MCNTIFSITPIPIPPIPIPPITPTPIPIFSITPILSLESELERRKTWL